MISREETIEAYINIATMFGTKPTKELIKKIPKKELVDVCYRLYEIIEEREKRIDKAIEYLMQNDIEILKYYDESSETSSYELVSIELLKILKGE